MSNIFSLCQQYLVSAGESCQPPDFPGDVEDWGNLARWEPFGVNANEFAETRLTPLGGQLIVGPDGPQSSPASYDLAIRTALRYDLRGHEVVVRVEPSFAGDEGATMVEILSPTTSGSPWPIAQVEARNGATPELRAFVQFSGDAQLETASWDRSAHAWWRFRFGPESDWIQLAVAGDCGVWDTLVDLANPAAGDYPMSCMQIRVLDNVWDGAVDGTERTRINEIYIRPTNPDPPEEEPES